MGEETKHIENPCDENSCAALPPSRDGNGMFSSHLEFPSEILDEAGQRPFGPWPHVNFMREWIRKRLIHDEIDMC